jgi:hypothetical protein
MDPKRDEESRAAEFGTRGGEDLFIAYNSDEEWRGLRCPWEPTDS